MKIQNIILIALLIPIFIAIILFNIKFLPKFYYNDFMHSLEDKVFEKQKRSEINNRDADVIIYSFEEIFCRYSDSSVLMQTIYIMTSICILIISLIELIILVIIQLKKTCCGCCKKCCSIYFLIHSLLNMIIYLAFAFDEKSEINLEKDKVYIYDEEFNKEIKKNLDFMKSRKIYLIVCTFVAILGILGELIIVILNWIDDYKNKKEKPQIIYVENSKDISNVNSNEIDINITN